VRASFLVVVASAAVFGGILSGCADSPNRLGCLTGSAHSFEAPCAAGTRGAESQAQEQAQAQANAQAQAAADDAKCQSYGAKRGDPAYIQCRTQLDAERAQMRSAVLGALVGGLASRPTPQVTPMPQPQMPASIAQRPLSG